MCKFFGFYGFAKSHLYEMAFKEMKLHKCDICDYENESITMVNMHIKRVHEDTRDQICEHCGKAFVLKSYLNKHIQG